MCYISATAPRPRHEQLTSPRLTLSMISACVGSSPSPETWLEDDDCSPDSAASALAGASVCYFIRFITVTGLSRLTSPRLMLCMISFWLGSSPDSSLVDFSAEDPSSSPWLVSLVHQSETIYAHSNVLILSWGLLVTLCNGLWWVGSFL